MEPITEREPHTMLTVLDELMGPDVASTLVRHLPPGGWADVATKHDLVQLEDRLTHRFDAALTRQLSDLRAELHGQLHGEIGSLRSELHTEIGSVRSDMQAMTRTYILGNVGLVFSRDRLRGGATRLSWRTPAADVRAASDAAHRRGRAPTTAPICRVGARPRWTRPQG